MAQTRSTQPQEVSAIIRHGPRPGRLHGRHRPQSLEQQKPRRQQARTRRPRRPARQRPQRLLPGLPDRLPHRHRGIPPGPRRGPAERQREAAGRGAAALGARGVHRGGAPRRGQRLRVPQGLRCPGGPQDGSPRRLEADEGQGESAGRAHGEGPD